MSLVKPIAVINHTALIEKVKAIGFPMNHRMNLDLGGLGYKEFHDFIVSHVFLIEESEYKKNEHVRIWSSAKVIGEVPSPENYYSRGLVTGQDGIDSIITGSPCGANFQYSSALLGEDYIADYTTKEDGTVDVGEYLRVLIHEEAKETYLGYGITIPVELLWTIHRVTDNNGRFWMERSVFPPVSLCDEVFYVRELSQVEIDKHFIQDEEGNWHIRQAETTTIQDVEAVDLTGFEDTTDQYITVIGNQAGLPPVDSPAPFSTSFIRD